MESENQNDGTTPEEQEREQVNGLPGDTQGDEATQKAADDPRHSAAEDTNPHGTEMARATMEQAGNVALEPPFATPQLAAVAADPEPHAEADEDMVAQQEREHEEALQAEDELRRQRASVVAYPNRSEALPKGGLRN